MTKASFKSLHAGDIVKSKLYGESYIVTGNYGGRVTAVKTVDLTNPDEWDLTFRANHIKVRNDIPNDFVKAMEG